VKRSSFWTYRNKSIFGKPSSAFRLIFLCVFLFICFSKLLASERLPLTVYSAADGLASSVIHHIARDSQGFLWFCARGGLSRFDGYEFTSYRFGDDQTSVLVHYFLETRDGTFWIATDGGLYRVKPQEKTEILPSNENFRQGERKINAVKVSDQTFFALHEDKKGRLWGGINGIYLIENLDAETVTLHKTDFQNNAADRPVSIVDFAETADGSVWAANSFSIVRILPDARFISYEVPRLTTRDESFAIEADLQGRIWFSHITGVFVFQPESLEALAQFPNQAVINLPVEEIDLGISGAVNFPADSKKMLRLAAKDFEKETAKNKNKFGSPMIEDLYQSSDGKIWLPTRQSLYFFEGENYQSVRDSTALPGSAKQVAEDLQGNLWFGTFGGAVKYKRNGLITYNEISGLPNPVIHLISETPNGEVLAFHGNWQVSRWTNEGFESIQLNMPESARFSWTSFPIFQDRTGSLWVLTLKGLFRYPPTANFAALASAAPQNVTYADLMPKQKPLYRAFSDSRQNVWFSARGAVGKQEDSGLFKYNLQSGKWQDFSKTEGYPPNASAVSFAEDQAGNLWFGFYGGGGLFKFFGNRFTEITRADGLPDGSIFALHVDRKGRLWLGSAGGGLARIDNPAAEKPEFIRYGEKEGLSSNNVRCLAEDAEGNIYAGTVRGVTQINPETNQTKQLTTADGLAADFVHAAFRDSRGVMWFGTANGLSKYVPSKENSAAVAQVLISDLQIAGTNYGLSEFGQKEIGGIEVGASENNLQINFFSVGEKEKIKYQFKLEGAAQEDWSSPIEQRSVNFANLAPGSYRFLVRALNDAGQASEKNAIVVFKIRPPFWQRWWFLILCALFITLVLYAIYQYRTRNLLKINAALSEAKLAEENLRKSREERLAELQKVRSRIATDLHDDIGSSLTQIAVYSEVARQRERENGTAGEPLDLITNVANELVDTMSDIVWAINPKKDHLQDLTQRMRRFAANVLSAKEIDFEFLAPDSTREISLGANIRREVFLIFKETVNNIVKHSEATTAEIVFSLENNFLTVNFKDNGKGFDQTVKESENGHHDWQKFRGGNGLLNMRKRAEDLGGKYEISSEIGKGTTVILQIPLDLSESSAVAGG